MHIVPTAFKHWRSLASLGMTIAVIGCGGSDVPADAPFEITGQYPHDSTAYTQGLVWADSVLYESTGNYGRSQLRRVDLRTGRVLQSVALGSDRFGEGLALLGGRLYQLTWQEHVGYVYDPATLALVDSFKYAGEGWGLATDGTSLILSDGSDSLRFLSPKDFSTTRVVKVKSAGGSPVQSLNELEWMGGDLLANVYQTNWIVRINPATGEVREQLDLAALYPATDRPRGAEVMNGIAVAPDGTQLLLTGKFWPVLFQVRLKPSAGAPAR
jgi:glutamine cyclotransferase